MFGLLFASSEHVRIDEDTAYFAYIRVILAAIYWEQASKRLVYNGMGHIYNLLTFLVSYCTADDLSTSDRIGGKVQMNVFSERVACRQKSFITLTRSS